MKIKKHKIYFLPRTKLGKWSFWLVISGFLVIIILNIIAGLLQTNDYCDANGICYSEDNGGFRPVRIVFSLLAMACIVIAGIASILAIVKYQDFAVLLFLSALIGLMGIMFVLGEFLFPH